MRVHALRAVTRGLCLEGRHFGGKILSRKLLILRCRQHDALSPWRTVEGSTAAGPSRLCPIVRIIPQKCGLLGYTHVCSVKRRAGAGCDAQEAKQGHSSSGPGRIRTLRGILLSSRPQEEHVGCPAYSGTPRLGRFPIAARTPLEPERDVMLDNRAHLTPNDDGSKRTTTQRRRTGTIRELRGIWREARSSHADTVYERESSRRKRVERIAAELASNLDQYWSAAGSVTDGPIDVVDMFSGCGGMSAGFRALNGLMPAFRFAGAVDIDHISNRSYEANLGIAPLTGDISELAAHDYLPREAIPGRRSRAPLVLIGCAPCQGFSSYRNRKGVKDRRNPLFMDFANIASRLLPTAIVVENVPELLTNRHWRLVHDARTLLERRGYFVHLSVHNMAEFGLPQERFRALLVAMRRPFRLPGGGFLERAQFKTVRDTIAHLPRVQAG